MDDALLSRVKAEVAKIRYLDQGRDPLLTASEELEALKAATAEATEEILMIGEAVLSGIEAIRTVNSAGPAPAADGRENAIEGLLANMELNLGRLFEACGFQDLTGQRSTKVARLLHGLGGRVERVIDLLDHVEVSDEIALQVQDEEAGGDAALLNGPQVTGEGLAQNDIDALFP